MCFRVGVVQYLSLNFYSHNQSNPYMKTKHLKHLLARSAFGTNAGDLERYKSNSRKEVVESLFDKASTYTPLLVDISEIQKAIDLGPRKLGKQKIRKLIRESASKVADLNVAWIKRLQTTDESLRERMTLFWANHFVCRDTNILHIMKYNNTLREHALGNFKDFVLAISKEASMIKYLNNRQNKKGKPNENFARELMELFTLGRDQYTEEDIKEAARAFTGWNHDFVGDFRLVLRHHDFDLKEFFGQTGNFGGEDIIDIILEKPECAAFICRKVYRYFVNEEINEQHVKQMVKVFYPNYDIAELMRFVFMSDWFYEEKNIGTKIKSPMDLLAGMYRVVPFEFNKIKQLRYVQRLLGQVLLNPPNVAGWEGGKGWVNTNTLMVRMRLASVLLNSGFIAYEDLDEVDIMMSKNAVKKNNLRRRLDVSADWQHFEKEYESLPKKTLQSLLLSGEVTPTTERFLQENEAEDMREFLIQIMSLPEYQMC